MTESRQAELGADGDPTGYESSEELCKRLHAVLGWIANGDQERFDDYARVAAQTADEVKAALDGWKASRTGEDANPTVGSHKGDETGAVVIMRRQGNRDSSLAAAHR